MQNLFSLKRPKLLRLIINILRFYFNIQHWRHQWSKVWTLLLAATVSYCLQACARRSAGTAAHSPSPAPYCRENIRNIWQTFKKKKINQAVVVEYDCSAKKAGPFFLHLFSLPHWHLEPTFFAFFCKHCLRIAIWRHPPTELNKNFGGYWSQI